MVRNLNLANVSASANPGFNSSGVSQWVGTLAGTNAGTIRNVSATGAVNGGNIVGVVAGGLVGANGLLGPNQPGLITQSNATVAVTVGNGAPCSGPGSCTFNSAGGLVGANVAGSTIENSYAQGNVVVGGSSWGGGLVGNNGLSSADSAFIVNSYATGNVSSAGVMVGLGGLAGFNGPGSAILTSYATGNVTASASVPQNSADCGATNSCQNAAAGGLVGQNFGVIGTITEAVLPALTQTCGAGQTCASGAVSVGANGTGGGLVGFNNGAIGGAFATGNVTGAAGTGGVNGQGGMTTLGGFAGNNQGLIVNSFARGNVGSPNVASLQAGGLVGDNSGAIVSSTALGNVQTGDTSIAGGLAGSSSPNTFNCVGCLIGDGFPFFNAAVIVDAQAGGNVSVGAASVAGGLVGAGDGTIAISSATGAVTGGGNSVLGGFIGALSFNNGLGFVYLSASSGPVTSTGPNSTVGGFVGLDQRHDLGLERFGGSRRHQRRAISAASSA